MYVPACFLGTRFPREYTVWHRVALFRRHDRSVAISRNRDTGRVSLHLHACARNDFRVDARPVKLLLRGRCWNDGQKNSPRPYQPDADYCYETINARTSGIRARNLRNCSLPRLQKKPPHHKKSHL